MRWPVDFGRRFTVFVDVEEEFDWSAPLSSTNRAVTAIGALPAAHDRFAARGVGLACMVDHPVAADPVAAAHVARVLEDPRSTLGAQLHPWVTPPYAPHRSADSFAGTLPEALEAAKIDTLTDTLTAAFGRAPIAYRAGRYGIGPRTTRLLRARGYAIETSVRARYDYGAEGGPDFSRVGNAAFRMGGLLELPLTTVFTGAARRLGPALYPVLGRLPRGRGLFARAGLIQRIALTPEDMPIAAALAAVTAAVEDGEPLLCFAFHSPSLMPGHTPYVRDAADLARFWRWWDAMLDHLDRLGVRPASLDEIAAAACA